MRDLGKCAESRLYMTLTTMIQRQPSVDKAEVVIIRMVEKGHKRKKDDTNVIGSK